MLAEPAIRDKMEQIGVAVVGSTPEELARHLKAETELWGPVIKAAQHPERVRTASFQDGAQAANPSAKSTTWLQDFRELFAWLCSSRKLMRRVWTRISGNRSCITSRNHPSIRVLDSQ